MLIQDVMNVVGWGEASGWLLSNEEGSATAHLWRLEHELFDEDILVNDG